GTASAITPEHCPPSAWNCVRHGVEYAQSHSAAEAERLWPEDLGGLAAHELAALRLPLHPATRWAWFADLPIASLWRAAREHWPDPNPPAWQGEGLLLTRSPDGAVQWQPLS
ncbi:MAG: hypothetical protein Q7T22_06755, partial [Serpentinimonas sp.]|nr:hypothetical protein [Serpentinimonas sp.]